jgi:hypothetical protein
MEYTARSDQKISLLNIFFPYSKGPYLKSNPLNPDLEPFEGVGGNCDHFSGWLSRYSILGLELSRDLT